VLIARGTSSAGHSSVTYAIEMMKIPGVTSPCTNRQNASEYSPVAVAVSSALTASATIASRIVRFRRNCSPNTASSAAEIATPSVDALMVIPTCGSVSWNTRANSGNSGCTQ
jgi:hypothetical protein